MRVRSFRRAGVALAAATALGLSAAACSSGSQGSDSGASSQAELAVKTSPDAAVLAKLPAKAEGAEIVVGDPNAPHTVTVYEDPRCPFCKHFEAGGASAVARLAADGKVKVRYTIASFLDANFGGDGSKRAANAMRAAVERGKFPEFHAAVFASQPAKETDDGFTTDNLLKIADQVPGLRGAAFDQAVRENTYKDYVKSAESAFEDSGVNNSPTVLIDGKKPGGDGRAMFDAEAFKKVLADAGIS
ncbi:thioredoxin domain-containing protein [Streptomyces sp. NBC_00083]|uniref:DsbA family protein n=1 Tax=Streptomyces sp. NBC_00083 TaxID=2975647 RepID=UPI00225A125C|nr:thioredoxin domain-containing protein [Streptomyces sp. NBC_00083]MCX5387842.1 DsbA family protein [Streptomyces sp. NBC_00083]